MRDLVKIVVGVFLFFTASLQAQSDAVRLSEAYFLDAGQGGISLAQFQAADSAELKALDQNNTYLGFTDHQYWLRFKLENTTNTAQLYYLKTGRAVTDSAELFYSDQGDLQQASSGDQIAFADRSVANRETVFPIKLEAGASKDYYLKMRSDGETLDIGLNLISSAEFLDQNYQQQLFIGLFYGVLFISTIIYLFFYTSLRESAFLYYSIYVASIAFLQGSLDGLIFQYFLPSGGYFNSRMVLISAAFSNFFLLKYAASFLKVAKRAPKLHMAYRVFYFVIPAIAALVFVSPEVMAAVYPISNINGLLSLLLILGSVFYIHFKVKPIDRFFLTGIFFLVVGLLGFVMNNLSLLPNSFWIVNSAKFGISLEVIFLSLSMTNLIAKLRRAKEASQAEALKKAQEVSAYKTFFMSNISHELRTPINAILGIASQQLADSKDQESQDNYRIIKSASFSLLSNVNDILDFEQIEKDKLELNNDQVFKPAALLEDLCDSWSYEAKRKGLGFAFNLGKSMPRSVKGDERRFRQIVNNLISNAVKFTDSGQVQVNLHCEIDDNAKAQLKLTVSDSGIGMDEEQQKMVFESFNQMKLGNKRRYGGLGLGLTIVRHLVKLFDAKIKLESELGLGTTVRLWMELPVEVMPATEEEVKPQAQKDQLRILLAEDNPMNQMIMKKILSDQAHIHLDTAADGLLALDKLKEERYDMVLMDLQMPNMDGYECCEAIRRGEAGLHHQEMPIIAVTADAMQETRKRVLDLGMNAYMTKPVRKDQLLEKINGLASSEKLKAV